MKADNRQVREWANCVGDRKSCRTAVPTPFNLNPSWDEYSIMIQPRHRPTQ